jgi:hypothetical protein
MLVPARRPGPEYIFAGTRGFRVVLPIGPLARVRPALT